jgi:putative GTP pyrophosphokinase
MSENVGNIVAEEWYSQNRPKYALLVENVTPLIKTLLKDNNIDYYAVHVRVKNYESFKRKLIKKGFPNVDPLEIKDFAGVRIISYLISDVERISNVIKSSFRVLEYEDKSRELGVDRVGYNSIHIIATLSEYRIDLPEYTTFKDIKFEIQIKTILQHAWAEIEHKRVYKYDEIIPEGIPRRFKRLAGMLEEIDVVFQEISNDIEKDPKEILAKIKNGELNLPNNPTTLKQYVIARYGDIPSINPRYGITGTERILGELKSLGIRTLADLEARVNSKIRNAYEKQGQYSDLRDNITGLVRHILMTDDAKLYFEKAWNNHFHTIPPTELELLADSGADVEEILKHVKISTKGLG